MKNFEKYQDQIAKCIIDCKKTYITICNFCERKEMCDQLHNVEQIKKWFFEEYKEQIKPKEDEKVILRNLLKKHKYLARDEDGTIWLFGQKPHKGARKWVVTDRSHLNLDAFKHLFVFVKWEDEEPRLIEDLLKEN